MAKTALITGVSGQDGAYLARLLLEKDYRVVGGRRRGAAGDLPRLAELRIAGAVEIVDFDLSEPLTMSRALTRFRPDEIYNLAAQSVVAWSFNEPLQTADANAIGPLRLLQAIRQELPAARFYQASTCEMFGKAQAAPQDETTPFYPRSPYGYAKLFAHWATVNCRESHSLWTCSGILFNHESPLRSREFVTRKITWSLAQIRYGGLDVLQLGNLDAQRDWGFAGDYVEGMWMMLQQPEPQDFVLASGEARTVRGFVTSAASRFGFDLEWCGTGGDEHGIDRRTGRIVVRVDPSLYRPAEVDALVGNPAKAQQRLGWQRKLSFDELVTLMAEADARRVRDG